MEIQIFFPFKGSSSDRYQWITKCYKTLFFIHLHDTRWDKCPGHSKWLWHVSFGHGRKQNIFYKKMKRKIKLRLLFAIRKKIILQNAKQSASHCSKETPTNRKCTLSYFENKRLYSTEKLMDTQLLSQQCEIYVTAMSKKLWIRDAKWPSATLNRTGCQLGQQ